MEKFTQLGADIVKLWSKYGGPYLTGMRNTLVLALVATAIGCVIGFICGILNTIPCSDRDPMPKRVLLKIVRIIVRVYVEVFRGTPMVLQAVFLYYGLPYFTNNTMKFTNIWVAAILVVSINTGAYMAEIIRAGIESVDRGQMEASRSLGLSYGSSMARRGDEMLRRHYFGSLDTGRMVANSAFEAPFGPPMLGFRSDPYDNQSGEMEADGVGLYGDDTVTTKEVLKFEEVE